MNHSKTIQHILFVSLILALHIFTPSYFNGKSLDTLYSSLVDNPFFETVLDYRRTGEFYRRPFMYGLINIFSSYHQIIFILVSLISFIVSASLANRWVKQLLGDGKNRLVIPLFYLNYCILFAFTPAIMTFDDSLQYGLLFYWLVLVFSNRIYLSFIIFVLACISRETSFILLPILFVSTIKISTRTGFFYSILAIITYILYLGLYLPKSILYENLEFLLLNRPSALTDNFSTFNISIYSIASFIFTCGLAILSILHYFKNKIIYSVLPKSYIDLSIFIFIINTALVSMGGRMTESRLWFIGIIPLFPMMILTLENLISFFQKGVLPVKYLYYLIGFTILLFSLLYFPGTIQGKIFLAYKIIFSVFLIFSGSVLFWTIPMLQRERNKLT